MNQKLYEMLRASAEADVAKAKLSLDLLGKNPVGIGDHSTEDFYKNAEEALSMLDDATSRLETLEKFRDAWVICIYFLRGYRFSFYRKGFFLMFNSKKNSEFVKYIVLLGDHLLEEDYPEKILLEFRERHDFCMKELSFWKSRGNPVRYREALHSLLNWLHDNYKEL